MTARRPNFCAACGMRHERPQYQAWPEPVEEEWGPLKIVGFVLVAIGFIYAVVILSVVAA